MAALPPLSQIVGSHAGIYEGYYLQADPTNSGSIGSLDAARFLKKSSLKENVLSQIWDLSDPIGKGYLEKPGFFVALKLIALAQIGHEISLARLPTDTPPPNLGPVEPVLSPPDPVIMSPPPSAGANWAILPQEKVKYDTLFNSLQPVNGLASGDKVKPVLLNSKLPVDILGRIWDLSDVDKDGFLDKDEFAVAMHLVYRTLENDPVPTVLPPKLVPPSKRKRVSIPHGGIQVLPDGMPPRTESPTTIAWVVAPTEKANYDILFKKTDTDMDGYVSGNEIKDVFLQSGLGNNTLAHIWSLCDMKNTGKLNVEQFALAMHLVTEKKKGANLPAQITPEMIPPSFRSKTNANAGPAAFGVMIEDATKPVRTIDDNTSTATDHAPTLTEQDGTNSGPYSHVADFSAIKELDMISKEIDDMKREKLTLEKEKSQRDADIKIKNGEVQALQKDLDAITATLHQLENQKKEAQKRLDELDDKRSNLEINVKEMKDKCDEEQRQIDEYKMKISNQEKSVQEQEDELNTLRSELNRLRDEEINLEAEVAEKKTYLENLIKNQKDTQLQISQGETAKTRLQNLQDQQRGVSESIANLKSQVNGEFASFPAGEADQFSNLATAGSSPISIGAFSHGSSLDEFRDDPFKGKDPFANAGIDAAPAADPFQNEDPFKGSDPFTQDPFASEDPFKDAFPVADNDAPAFPKDVPDRTSSSPPPPQEGDPFSQIGADPFESAFTNSSKKSNADPFAAFSSQKPKTSARNNKGDLFGSVPFVKSNSKSPTPPNLPPKQKKQPPPRPAPPRPKSSPAAKKKDELFANFGNDPFTGNDPFASSIGNDNSDYTFESFADFSPSKFGEEANATSAWGTSQ